MGTVGGIFPPLFAWEVPVANVATLSTVSFLVSARAQRCPVGQRRSREWRRSLDMVCRG